MSRVAIIAVHGVGSPPQCETARSVADLLLQHATTPPGGAAPGTPEVTYGEFSERSICIPTSPVVLSQEAGAKPAATSTPGFAARARAFIPGERDRTGFAESDATAIADLDVAFMRDQLLGYEVKSERPPYKTVELVGSRVETGSPVRDDVHVFEMYWADLSRIGTGPLRIFGALYQLVLHIAQLGRKTLDLAASASALCGSESVASARWKSLAQSHALIVRLFTIAVPMSTLLITASILLFVPDAIAPGSRLLAGTIIAELVLLVLLGVHTYFDDTPKDSAGRFVAGMGLALALGVFVNMYAYMMGGQHLGAELFGGVVAALVVAAYVASVNRYDKAAPGALPWGMTGLVVAIVGAALWAPRFMESAAPASHQGLRFTALAGFQFSYVVLMVAWMLIWITALVTAFRAWRLRRVLRDDAVRPGESRTRALRAMWTAKVTLAVALFGFLITGLVAYESATVLAWRMHGTFNVLPSTPQGAPFPLISEALVPPGTACPATPPGQAYDPASCANRFFEVLVGQSATVGLPIAMATVVIALLLISWFIALVAVTSIHKPKSRSRYAEHVGNWVASGFVWLTRGGNFLVFGLGVALSFGFIAAIWEAVNGALPSLLPGVGQAMTERILGWLAVSVLATSATFAAARVRVSLLATRARPAIGIILDVDNYLRESPPEKTPRAMMAERFTSLLRHVVARKDEHGERYFDRLVIVSHSQGTVISADLLRFLTVAAVPDPDLRHVDVKLVTMGCPLRQLYATHFPHLYDWIDRSDDYGDGAKRDDDTAFEVRGIAGPPLTNPDPHALQSLTELSPSPRWLRVSQWVNLYTSGDYVGRSIWRRDSTPGVWDYETADQAAFGAGRRERCLGDGTHTRYWTDSEVAREIDAVVANPRAIAPALAPPAPPAAAVPAPVYHPTRSPAHTIHA